MWPAAANGTKRCSGNQILLFFRVDDYAGALTRARELVDQLSQEPHVNPNTQTSEFSLRDPDGYYVTISALSESSALVDRDLRLSERRS